MTAKIIKEYIKSLSPEFAGEKTCSVNQFHWALIERNEIPISFRNRKVDTTQYSPLSSLDNKWFSKADLAVRVSETLIRPTYQMKGIWDIGKSLEERFLSIDPQKIPSKFTNNVMWAEAWITPKEKLFLLPFEIAAAIVGNVIFHHCKFSEEYKSKIAANIAVDLIRYWGSNLFESGDILSHEKFNPYQKLINFCFFLEEDFAKDVPTFFM